MTQSPDDPGGSLRPSPGRDGGSRAGRWIVVTAGVGVGVIVGAVIALSWPGGADNHVPAQSSPTSSTGQATTPAPTAAAASTTAVSPTAPTTAPGTTSTPTPTTASTTPPPPPPPPTTPPMVQPVPVSEQLAASLPQATTYGRIDSAPLDAATQAGTDGTIVHSDQVTPVYASPGGPPIAMLPSTQLGTPTWLPIIARAPGWARVLLPARPNGATGWVYTNEQGFHVAFTPWVIHVDLEHYRLSVTKDGQEVGNWIAGFGLPEDPTPAGRTFLLSAFTDPGQTYSPVIVPLGVHSPTLDSFGGGPGTVAIHTWPSSDVFGTLSSNGCIRIPTDALDVVESIPHGSLVVIQ